MRINKRTESISDINNGTGLAKFLTIPIPTEMSDENDLFVL